MKKLSDNIFILLLALLMFSSELFSIWDRALTFDEGAHAHYGINILKGDSSRFDDSKMPVTALNAIPILGADILKGRFLGERIPTVFFYYSVARIPTMLFSLLVLFAVYLWTDFLYGRFSARLAALFFALSPNIIAHSSLITNDVYAMGGLFFSVISLFFYLRKRSYPRLFLLSLSVAFAMISKFTCIFIYPLFFLIIALKYFSVIRRILTGTYLLPKRFFIKALFAHFAIFAIANLALINAAYFFNGSFRTLDSYQFKSDDFKRFSQIPLLSSIPLPLPAPMIEGMDWIHKNQTTGTNFGNIYMLGKTAPKGEGFKLYYLIVWLFKIPLGTQILFYLAFAQYLLKKRKRIVLIFREREFLFLLVPAFFFFLLLSLVLKAQLGVRYMLLCMPFILIFAVGNAGLFISSFPIRRLVFILLCLWNFVSVASYYPHFLSYFNELSFDRKNNWKILADSNIDWGQNVKYLCEYAHANPDIIFNPELEAVGNIVVDVNHLTGVLCSPEKYAWLRNRHEAVGHVAYSYIVYRIPLDGDEK